MAFPVRTGHAVGGSAAGIGRGWRRRVAGLILAGLLARSPAAELEADFPGGNLRILSRTGSTFTVAPDLRDTTGWWFHFHFRLRADAGETATVVFPGPNPIGVRGPAVSLDGGLTWKWAGADRVRKISAEGPGAWAFEVEAPAGAVDARWAFAPAYTEAHWRAWLAAKAGRGDLAVGELCRSRQGRRVEVIRAGGLDPGKIRGVVLLTARHHACESIASYVLEGLLDAALAEDDLGRRWRSQWQIVAMPFADKDGVEQGDQGKNRRPHDHNRDYNASPLYPEVAAWMKLGSELAPAVRLSLDLHCPHIRGQWNDRVYLVGSAGGAWPEKERAFVRTLSRVRRGPIPVREADCYLPAGVAWNTAGNYSAGRSNAAWARDTFPDARLAATLEITYADAFGVEMNANAARALGRDLAEAILVHLGDGGISAP
ncbi:MAG: hypothetical protein HZC55_25730 [Verrucomicrobia bacterium]|nr:hypothetical protein [Verrucomicrobiota bacterium]